MSDISNLEANEVRVKVEWGGSSARDLLYLQCGWLIRTPKALGRNFAGVVVEVGEHIEHVVVDDQVFGCIFESAEKDPLRISDIFLTARRECVAKIPSNISPQAAVTIPSSFISAFHAINEGLKLPLPWPNNFPDKNPNANSLQLIWGAGGTLGQHAIELLRYYGFKNRFAVSSRKQHGYLMSIGATRTFDWADPNVPMALFEATLELNHGSCPPGRFIIDLLASQGDSIAPIATLAYPGARVAVSVPIIGDTNHSTGDRTLYLDPILVAQWRSGVLVNAFRPEMYNRRNIRGDSLQSRVMPELVARSIITAAKFEEIEGSTLQSRVQKASERARHEGLKEEALFGESVRTKSWIVAFILSRSTTTSLG